MYAPYPENMMESVKKVEATRAERMATEPRRLTADEKDALLKEFHTDSRIGKTIHFPMGDLGDPMDLAHIIFPFKNLNSF